MQFPKQKRSTRQSAERTLWKHFSMYIRLRDRMPGTEMCRCATCRMVHHWKEMDAGHFVQRDRYATKYNEKNVHAQCPRCNRFRNGEQYAMSLHIDAKYGKGTAQLLLELSKAKCPKLSSYDIKAMSALYRAEVKKLLSK